MPSALLASGVRAGRKRHNTWLSLICTGFFSLIAAGCATIRLPKQARVPLQPVRIDACTQYYPDRNLRKTNIACLSREGQIRIAAAKKQGDMQVVQTICKDLGRKSVECVTARYGTYGEDEMRAIYKAEDAAVRRVWAGMPRNIPTLQPVQPVENNNAPRILPAFDNNQNSNGLGNKIVQQFRKNALAITASGATSFAVRSAAHTVVAASLPMTAPAIWAALAFAAGSALAGGLARVVYVAVRDRNENLKLKEEGWWLKEFGRGALWGGAAGAVIGALGLADYVKPHSFLRNLIRPAHIHPAHVTIPAHTSVTVSHPALPLQPQHIFTSAPQHTSTLSTNTAHALAATDIKSLLTPDQFKSLPETLQKLANSDSTRDVIIFCKEASARLARQHTASSYKAAAKLIQRALNIAAQHDIHNRLIEKLQADMAYLKAWKLGPDSNICSAFEYAKHAGSAMHNYASRLAHFIPKNCPAPTAG